MGVPGPGSTQACPRRYATVFFWVLCTGGGAWPSWGPWGGGAPAQPQTMGLGSPQEVARTEDVGRGGAEPEGSRQRAVGQPPGAGPESGGFGRGRSPGGGAAMKPVAPVQNVQVSVPAPIRAAGGLSGSARRCNTLCGSGGIRQVRLAVKARPLPPAEATPTRGWGALKGSVGHYGHHVLEEGVCQAILW